jgi:hypothetical protein
VDIFTQFHADLTANSPDWVRYWLAGLIGVLSGSVLFALVRAEGRAILMGVLMGMAMTILIYAQFGFTRILGVGHVLFWTPTLFYMLSLQGTAGVEKTWFGRWLWLAIAVMAGSLMLDYADLARYFLGDRGPIRL